MRLLCLNPGLRLGAPAEAAAAPACAGTRDTVLVSGPPPDEPDLSDLLGGIQAVTLSDEEARRRGTRKTILERKAPPRFDILVEIQNRNRLAVYHDIARVVERFLAGVPLRPEIRVREADGRVEIHPAAERREAGENGEPVWSSEDEEPAGSRHRLCRRVRIYPIGISRTRLEKAIRELSMPARLADQPLHADLILSLKAHRKKEPKELQQVLSQGVEFHTIRSNTLAQIRSFLAERFPTRDAAELRQDALETALLQAEDAVVRVQRSGQAVELAPQNSYLRRLQH